MLIDDAERSSKADNGNWNALALGGSFKVDFQPMVNAKIALGTKGNTKEI